VETFTAETQKANTSYAGEVNLSLFPRALDIADNFQEYRITKVTFKYTPQYDTYTSAAGSNTTLPYLYAKRLTYAAPAAFGLSFMTAMGAKPRRLDDKSLSVSYTPNINLFGTQGEQASTPVTPVPALMPKYKPWLSTHQVSPLGATAIYMDNTPHYGHVNWIDQASALPSLAVCGVEVTAHFEFRKPWELSAATGPLSQKIVRKAPKAEEVV